MKKKTGTTKTNKTTLDCRQLADLEHRLSIDLGNFLVLNEEGTSTQAETARAHLRSDLLKYGSEMQKLAGGLGEEYREAVDEFIRTVDEMVHAKGPWIDEALIYNYFLVSNKLEKKLQRRAA